MNSYSFPSLEGIASVQNVFAKMGITTFEPLDIGTFTREVETVRQVEVMNREEYAEFQKKLADEGFEIPFDSITCNPKTGLIELNGVTACLYMKVQRPDFFYGKGYKYHLFLCDGVKEQMACGKRDRFTVTSRHDGKFSVIVQGYYRAEMRKVNEQTVATLGLCNECRKILRSRGEYRRDFSLDAYYRKHGCQIAETFQRAETVMAEQEYVPEWRELSHRCRERAGWKCRRCSVDCSGSHDCLEVHHRNGCKTDNRPVNLDVLCTDCHANEPGHEFIRQMPERMNRIRRIRAMRKKQHLY